MQFISNVEINDSRWKPLLDLVEQVVLPYQWEILNDRVPDAPASHCVENFRIAAGLSTAKREGVVFLDSDLYKWLEAVGYLLCHRKNETLRKEADSAIKLIESAQMPDGYLNTYYQLTAPEEKWKDLMESHELYSAGHLIEAAVVYHRATGNETILSVAKKCAENIISVFGDSQRYPGHPEIELALFRLYGYTGESRYKAMAIRFLKSRGKDHGESFQREAGDTSIRHIWPGFINQGLEYFLADRPLEEMETAEGHAVRAMYLYEALAEEALSENEDDVKQSCRRLWNNVAQRKLYITGAIGSAAYGERLTVDWDLSSDSAYAESCASVGLIGFARRMWLLDRDNAYYDVIQRALENTIQAAMGKDGKHFFYVNPLQVVPEFCKGNPTFSHVETMRPKWFGVACCPPNIARCLLSLPEIIYAEEKGKLNILLPIASSFEGSELRGKLNCDKEEWTLSVEGKEADILIRIPEGTTSDKGGNSLYFHHPGGKAEYRFTFHSKPRFLRADPRVSALSGQVAVDLAGTVYCAEEADNGKALGGLRISTQSELRVQSDGSILAAGWRVNNQKALYSETAEIRNPVTIRLIPYRDWGSRGEGEMRVWLTEG